MPEDARVEIKPMFGNLGAFVNGNMFMGPFGPAERPMGGYTTLPAAFTSARAKPLEYVAALPPKKAKPAKKI